MNRRDLLKRTGTLALGLPVLGASGVINSAAQEPSKRKKDLIVTFNGPFCFWLNTNNIEVMAPPVGTDFDCAKHQAWMGTSTNEKELNSELQAGQYPPYYELMGLPKSPQVSYGGTCIFAWGQDEYEGANPLFTLILPIPHKIIGVRPTHAEIIFRSTPRPDLCAQKVPGLVPGRASGLTFLYRDVDLSVVKLYQSASRKSSNGPCIFKPCFGNDDDLLVATLGVHLTKLNHVLDEQHRHASYVWSQMLSMYPWMLEAITGIKFTPPPKASEPCTCAETTLIGPGNDCEVPIMMLTPGGNLSRQKR